MKHTVMRFYSKSFLFLLFFSICENAGAQSPSWQWAKGIGGVSSDLANSNVLDDMGNVYVVGDFHDTVDFDPGPGVFNLISKGRLDIFILKLDPLGNFIWAKAIGDTLEDRGFSIAVDKQGNVYTTGWFAGTVDFDPGLTGIFNLNSHGSSHKTAFVSKLDSFGNFVWAKSFGAPLGTTTIGYSIAVDSSGNVYTTGLFSSTADFNPDSIEVYNLTPDFSSQDIFISKLNISGDFIWAKRLGGTTSDVAYSIAVDVSGNIYLTGLFSGLADFDPDSSASYNLTSLGGSWDIFISKFDSAGNLEWAKPFGAVDSDMGLSIAVDFAGNVYTCGYFKGIIDFDPGPLNFNLSAPNTGVFISKLNSSGNFVWAKAIGDSNFSRGRSIAVDAGGNCYITGDFYGMVDFDPDMFSTYYLNSGGGSGAFILKLDSAGSFAWVKSMIGTSYNEGFSVSVNSLNEISIAGFFMSPSLLFDSIILAKPSFFADIFICKIGTTTTGIESLNYLNDVLAFPNPVTSGNFSITYLLPQNKSGMLEIFDINGKRVYSKSLPALSTLQQVSIPKLAGGMYQCMIRSDISVVGKKMVVIKE